MSQHSWTRPADIHKRLEKRWRSGELLRACHQPDALFPLRLPLKNPTAGQLVEHFDAARNWAAQWQAAAGPDLELEWHTVNNRQLGRNPLPVAAVFGTLEAALRHISQLAAARQYQALTAEIHQRFPELDDWCQRKPLTVLAQQSEWPTLMAILEWMAVNPRPGIYIRQLEIPGVHTKVIERNRGLLTELLDLILPESAIDTRASGARQFEQRYGFRRRPARLRFRFLDPSREIGGLRDIEVPVAQFETLSLPVDTVFIVENDITALAFPDTPSAIVIFGQGYGIGSHLANAGWLKDRDVIYWGDIDTHGFRILNQLRDALPHSRSLLMDASTLRAHRHLWGTEPSPHTGELPNLTEHEQAVYRMLGTLEPGRNLRLEQERISFTNLRAP
jgi:hypothetical protein